MGVDVPAAFFIGPIFAEIWVGEELELLCILGCSLRPDLGDRSSSCGKEGCAIAISSAELAIQGCEHGLTGLGGGGTLWLHIGRWLCRSRCCGCHTIDTDYRWIRIEGNISTDFSGNLGGGRDLRLDEGSGFVGGAGRSHAWLNS